MCRQCRQRSLEINHATMEKSFQMLLLTQSIFSSKIMEVENYPNLEETHLPPGAIFHLHHCKATSSTCGVALPRPKKNTIISSNIAARNWKAYGGWQKVLYDFVVIGPLALRPLRALARVGFLPHSICRALALAPSCAALHF